jgi:hypothetical protein
MMKAACRRECDHWIVNGRRGFRLLVDLPDPAIRVARVPRLIGSASLGTT